MERTRFGRCYRKIPTPNATDQHQAGNWPIRSICGNTMLFEPVRDGCEELIQTKTQLVWNGTKTNYSACLYRFSDDEEALLDYIKNRLLFA